MNSSEISPFSTPLSGLRCFFTLKGPDAERYLNGQVTNDVRSATAQKSIYALVTNAKGKLQGEVYIHRLAEEELLLDAPIEIRDSLFARLDQYLIADDAELLDTTEQWTAVHCFSEPDDTEKIIKRPCQRYGVDGWDLFSGEELIATDIPFINLDLLEHARISHSIPKWGFELNENIFPQEAGLEETAISFHKGCYVGQEVISRIKSVGRVNKLLSKLATEEHLSPEQQLFIKDLDSDKEYGHVTSISPLYEDGKTVLLGYIHRKAEDLDTFALCNTSNERIGVAERASA